MPITITFNERTGNPFSDEEVFNMNWKNQGIYPDSTHKYFYYPTRRPEEPNWVKHSATKFLYATISGTYNYAKRPRWKIQGLPMTDGVRLYIGHSASYIPPITTFDGSLTFGSTSPMYIYPAISASGPTSATSRLNTLVGPNTYYTDFLVTQLYVDDTSGYVGNVDLITVSFELDEYE